MESKFFTFSKPYLSYIDDGALFRKPFSWLYVIIAIVNLLIPLFVLYMAIDNRVFSNPAEFVIVFILSWLIISFACWIGFQLWWDRKDKINMSSEKGDEFIATPVFAHLIQTTGEWLGTWFAIVGFGYSLLSTIFLGSQGGFLSSQIGLSFLGTGVLSIILFPVYGFLIIISSRFLAEMFKAVASIANSTKRLVS